MGIIISVGYYAGNDEIKRAVLKSDDLRRRTLDILCDMPEYSGMNLSEKNRTYDEIKRQLMQNADH